MSIEDRENDPHHIAFMARHEAEQKQARKNEADRVARTNRARVVAGVTVGNPNQPDSEQVYSMLREYVEGMREQLRALNTEITRLRDTCGSYYGCNLSLEYCTEYNTAIIQANRLDHAIAVLEGDHR